MSDKPTNNNIQPPAPKEGRGYDILGQYDRLEFRMLTDERTLTPELEQQLIGELADWRRDHPNPKDHAKAYPLNRLVEDISGGGDDERISHSVLSEVLRGKYRGDKAKVFRLIDQFLADQRKRAGRYDFRQTAKIELLHKLFGTMNAAVVHGMMALIVGPPGSGKTCGGLAWQRERSGALYLRIEDEPTDKRRLSAQLCQAIKELRPMKAKSHPQRLDSIKSWLAKRRNTVLLLDESQKLGRSGLELARDLHDSSDPTGQHRMPIIFFADETFYQRLINTRSGHPTAIAPQLARRLVLVFDIRKQGLSAALLSC